MPRPKVPLLSADRIADAALELVDSGQPFGVNALARALGVTPSSLYNHVRGRDEIIELIRGRLAAQYLPGLPEGAWDEIVAATMRAERRMYAEHPNAIPLIVGKTITDALVIASYDNLATGLLDAGFPEDEVLTVVAILDSFALGFGLDLASPDDIWQPQGPTRTLGRLLAGAERGAARSDRAFEEGLELLLDALRLRLSRLREAD
ncbi:TetR/AcrR family transcriptional regulator [Agromyces sp. SYSU T00266]|uniref:TetR/AcrR family transcriptional regulator n=1 Tax=Agromyces zhanjiangensis TaxID=3158562 RepID=UPI003394EAF5